MIIVPSDIKHLLFEKDGYKPYSENVDVSTIVNVDLKKKEESGGTSSSIINHEEMSIYPNPVSQLLNVKFENEHSTNVQITLANLSAQILYQFTTNENYHTIDMQNWASGIYLLSVKIQDRYYVKKVIKN